MQSVKIDDVLETLRSLPPERLAEVKDFVEFLASKERENAFADFLSVADRVELAGIPAMSSEEIEAEINTYRNERPRADRT
ncbi:MAG: DUF2281 domain-containing protein [Gammaproteobacteria bacterium]|nr:DUF2281 domain-containing protein [Gammaproteobacteria bacterium]